MKEKLKPDLLHVKSHQHHLINTNSRKLRFQIVVLVDGRHERCAHHGQMGAASADAVTATSADGGEV